MATNGVSDAVASAPPSPPPSAPEPSASTPTSPPTTSKSEDSALIASLHALAARSPKLVKSSAYPAPADPSIQVRSWKMNEFKYYDIPSPFPTLARGLFTREVGEKQYEILVRGYDKFFNIGEVPWTTWASLEEHTAPPYTLSLKSNGCIIFIAALTPSKLLITSKHSLGPVSGVAQSHAQAGEAWLRTYLTKVGKSEADLARVLYDKNWTAIAELCDDSFEEHVLGYSVEKTGLHLHGLNVRSKHFLTEPTVVVDAFAEAWGFIKTPTVVLGSIAEVRAFTDECAIKGEWKGEPVEGFVVRSVVSEPPTEGRRKGKGKLDPETAAKIAEQGRSARSPYEAGSSFFFKVKFDEPYMMYRDWRELTKSLLSLRAKGSPLSASGLPKSKMKRPETKVYVRWVIDEIKRNPRDFEGFAKGHGIIRVRERFLRWLEGEEGKKELGGVGTSDALTGVGGGEGGKTIGEKKWGETIIVPVAIPGCGKTTISLILTHLFPSFAHTQSDDVVAKKAAPVFLKNVAKALEDVEEGGVVIADKNNHLKQHRAQLRALALSYSTTSFSPHPVRLLALDWSASVSDAPPAMVHRICSDRVVRRGGNHQTLVADAFKADEQEQGGEEGKGHEEVVWMFVHQMEELGVVDSAAAAAAAATTAKGKKGKGKKNEDKDEVAGEVQEGQRESKELESEQEVDAIIPMSIHDSFEESVWRAVRGVCQHLELDLPSEERVAAAMKAVEGYVATKRPSASSNSPKSRKEKRKEKDGGEKETEGKVEKKAKESGARYYAMLPEVDLERLLDGFFSPPASSANNATPTTTGAAVDDEMRTAWANLKAHNRVTKRPHITLVHRNNIADEQGEERRVWEGCVAVSTSPSTTAPTPTPTPTPTHLIPPTFSAKLGHVLWDGRVLAIALDEFWVEEPIDELSSSTTTTSPARAFVKSLPPSLKDRLHITVATRTAGIPAVEAKALVERWRAGSVKVVGGGAVVGEGEVKVYELRGENGEVVVVKGRVKGLMG